MTDDRYKEFMEHLGMENSVALREVLQQVAYESSKECISVEADHIVDASVKRLMTAALDLIQKDPHQWSKRPCPTCSVVSTLVGKPFGCTLYAIQKKDTK